MTEVHVVRHDNSDLYAAKLEQYFTGRYDVFVHERGWKELERPDGRDTDQFDTEEAIHLLAIDEHRVIGGMRMNPSTGPTLFTEVFSHLCLIPLVGSPDIYETTRLWVAKDRRGQDLRVNCIAVEKDVSEAIWVQVCRHLSVPGPILIWNGTARPPYRLPELVPAVA